MKKIQRLIELISEEIAALRARKPVLHHPVPQPHAKAKAKVYLLDDLPPAHSPYDPAGIIIPPPGPDDRL